MKNFLLSLLFNLIFSAELLVLAIIAFILHVFLDVSLIIVYVFWDYG